MKSKDHKVEQRSAPKIMLNLQLLQHVEMYDRCKSNGQNGWQQFVPKDLSEMKICFLGLAMLERVFNNLLSMVAFSDLSWCNVISSKLKYITF